jgi:hypothetical protein
LTLRCPRFARMSGIFSGFEFAFISLENKYFGR